MKLIGTDKITIGVDSLFIIDADGTHATSFDFELTFTRGDGSKGSIKDSFRGFTPTGYERTYVLKKAGAPIIFS